MCCEPVWTASGQTYGVVMEVTSPGFYGILLCYQNTSTRMNTDSCTGRSSALWEKCWMGKPEALSRGGEPPPLGWHKMQALPCCTCGFKGLKKTTTTTFIIAPFVSQPCRTLGLSRGSRCRFDFQHRTGSSRLQHICVF